MDGQYQNEAEVVFRGAEINFKAYPLENLTLSLGYTYTIAKNKSDEAVTEHMVNIPKHKVDMGIDYLIPVVTTKLHLQGMYFGESYAEVPIEEGDDPEEKLNDYFILNGRLSKQFLEHFEGYVEVNNIFDKDYYSEESFPGRGRSFLVGLSAKI
jgi:outer membrane receptor protein involved in Fe transport